MNIATIRRETSEAHFANVRGDTEAATAHLTHAIASVVAELESLRAKVTPVVPAPKCDPRPEWLNIHCDQLPTAGQLCLVYSRPFPLLCWALEGGCWHAVGRDDLKPFDQNLWLPIPQPPGTFA